MKFRTLRADEVDARVGTCNENGFSLLLYKDARCDQNILDETVGAENWQRRHYEVKGNMFCSVGIYSEQKKEWIWKDDCGTESNTEKEKGEASDSFKRACFNWGIGRELYTAPFIYVKGNTEKNSKGQYVPIYKSFTVKNFECADGKIIKLQILGYEKERGIEVIFEYGMKNGEAKSKTDGNGENKSTKTIEKEAHEYRWEQGKNKGVLLRETSESYLEWYLREGRNEHIKEMIKVIIGDDMQPLSEDGLPF